MMRFSAIQWAMMLALVVLAFPELAAAQAPNPIANTCTYNPSFDITQPAAGSGIVTTVITNIANIINNLGAQLYQAIIANPSFQVTVRASLTLYVMIYGILFTYGMAQVSLMDFMVRIIKFGMVALIVSPGSWEFFNSYIGAFFSQSTDWLVCIMGTIATGANASICNAPDASQQVMLAFAPLDHALAVLTSSRMAVTLIAMLFTGPYGLILGLMVLYGLGTFAAAVFQAMWIYLMSLVVRAFLFAMAPLFLTFMLFQRTFHLFQGWINSLVSACLQPIFLFAFFGFFSQLVQAAMLVLLRTPVCTTPLQVWNGSPQPVNIWRFMVPVLDTATNQIQMQIYNGSWGASGPDLPTPPAPVFPVSVVDILIFILLVQLAWRFNDVVVRIAKEIAGASLSLNLSSGIGGLFSSNVMGGTQRSYSDFIRNNLRPGGGARAGGGENNAAGNAADAGGNAGRAPQGNRPAGGAGGGGAGGDNPAAGLSNRRPPPPRGNNNR